MIEWIKDKYLTWKTGYDKQEREWRKWQDTNIVFRANTVQNKFMHFKYIIPVSTQIFDESEPFGWCPHKEFKQYLYPQRELGDNAVYSFERGYWNQHDNRFHICDLIAELDQVFVATNNEQDAIMIALKYA